MNNKLYRALVYPYNKNFVRYLSSDIINGSSITITSLVAPKGFALNGKDAGAVDNRSCLDYTVTDDYEGALNDADTVLIPEGVYHKRLYDLIMAKIEIAIQQKKNIICCTDLDDADCTKLRGLCKENCVEFIFARSLDLIEPVYIIQDALYRPNASVIFVGELVSDVNGGEIVYSLANSFRSDNYKVSVIAPTGFAQVLGFHNTDTVLLSNHNHVDEKIIAFNNYIKYIDKSENPDLIIIQIPGGLMAFNELFENSFGIYAHMISNAVNPDCFICCFPFDYYYSSAVFDEYKNLFKNRLGAEIDIVHVSNAALDFTHLIENRSHRKLYLSTERINELITTHCTKGSIPVFCAIDPGSNKALCKEVANMLTGLSVASAI